jgi:uncharacterized protein (TIGR03435 family)
MTRLCVIASMAFAAFAQQPAASVFEAASVKVADPNPSPVTLPDGNVQPAIRGCRRPNPATLSCTSATLKQLLTEAYSVKPFQIEGPGWLDSDLFDVSAKGPAGTTWQQMPAMIQALLAERFHVVLHKDSRLSAGYELIVAKGGPKLNEVDKGEVAAYNAAEAAGAAPAALKRNAAPPMGVFTISMSSTGARRQRGKMTMGQLTSMLTNLLSRPVVDKTELKGTYDIDLAYLADDSDSLQRQIRAQSPPSIAAGGAPAASADTPIPTLIQSVQALGLKLDSKKVPLDVYVIESANKVPVAN